MAKISGWRLSNRVAYKKSVYYVDCILWYPCDFPKTSKNRWDQGFLVIQAQSLMRTSLRVRDAQISRKGQVLFTGVMIIFLKIVLLKPLECFNDLGVTFIDNTTCNYDGYMLMMVIMWKLYLGGVWGLVSLVLWYSLRHNRLLLGV